jgi:uncharacterized OB-fold protein
VPNRDDQFFWDAMAEHRLLFQRCGDCGTVRHPPQPMCGACGSLALDTIESAGHGTLFSWIVSAQPDGAQRIAALIELDEGIRFVSNLVGVERDGIAIGMPVVVEFHDMGEGLTLPQFRPASAGGGA